MHRSQVGAVSDTRPCATNHAFALQAGGTAREVRPVAFDHYQHDDPKPDKKQRLLMSTMPRAELLSLLADLLQERAEQDGLHGVSFVLAVSRSI